MNTQTVIALVVTFVWAVTYLAAILIRDFQPSILVNGVMMVIVGFFFATGVKQRNGDHDDPRKQ